MFQRLFHRPVGIVAVVVLLLAIAWRWTGPEGNSWKWTIGGDGKGYYAYLPALFIYGDPSYSFLEKKSLKAYRGRFYNETPDGKVNRYFAGSAMLMAPFFALGCLGAAIGGFPVDGYSLPFQIAISLGAWVYLLIALMWLKAFLRSFGLRNGPTGFALIATVLGTNLLFYTALAPSMSHVYAFFALSGFLHFGRQTLVRYRTFSIVAAAVCFALLVLIRPTHGIALLLLPLLGARNGRWAPVWEHWGAIGLAVLAGTAVVLVQPALWNWQTGHWLLWSYGGEGFFWTEPEFLNVLFSFRKGVFVYAPILLIALVGFGYLWRWDRRAAIWTATWLLVNTYLIAVWWNWFYGDSFGHRAFIDLFPVFALLMGAAFSTFRSGGAGLGFRLVVGVLMVWCLLQTYQYTHGLIHPNAMDAEKWAWSAFRFDENSRGAIGGTLDLPRQKLAEQPVVTYSTGFESMDDGWNDHARSQVGSKARNGTGVSMMTDPYSTGLITTAGKLVEEPFIFLKGSLWWNEIEAGGMGDAELVISFDRPGDGNYFYHTVPIRDLPGKPGNWYEADFALEVPTPENPDDILKVYLWQKNPRALMLDDVTLEFFGAR